MFQTRLPSLSASGLAAAKDRASGRICDAAAVCLWHTPTAFKCAQAYLLPRTYRAWPDCWLEPLCIDRCRPGGKADGAADNKAAPAHSRFPCWSDQGELYMYHPSMYHGWAPQIQVMQNHACTCVLMGKLAVCADDILCSPHAATQPGKYSTAGGLCHQ